MHRYIDDDFSERINRTASHTEFGMDRNVFREVSLDRLSSAEELDRLLQVTSSKAWIAQFAMFGLIAIAIIWSYAGRLPSVVAGQGVIVRRGGVLNVVAAGSGVVAQIKVNVGDRIAAGQIVANVEQPAISEKHKSAQQMLKQARLDRERSLALRDQETKLAITAVQRKSANALVEIAHAEDQAKLAKQDIAAQDELLADGIVTKEKTIEARQKLASIEDHSADLRAHIQDLDAEEFSLRAKLQQEDAQKQAAIQDLDRNLRGVEKELEIAQNVVSPYGGEVLEVKVSWGATVATGDPILSIQPDVPDLQVLLYLPASQSKDVHPGMNVRISPSSVKPEEFGFIKGNVVYVSDFPDTPAELMRNFENEVLVKALTGEGPVTELHVEMEKDSKTPSGYQWSSSKGPNLTLSGGTLCTGEVVTRWQRPITLVLPSLRKAMGLT
jgi:HlyD family secretion protein